MASVHMAVTWPAARVDVLVEVRLAGAPVAVGTSPVPVVVVVATGVYVKVGEAGAV